LTYRSKVKVTAGRQGGYRIRINAGLSRLSG